MTNAIDIHSVTRRFGRATALDDVSFSIGEPSIVGLLGRNGAGKTSLLSIIAGQDRATTGEVEVLGHSPFEHEATLAQITYVRDNQRYPDGYRMHHVLRIAPEFAPNWSSELAEELAEGLRIPTRTPIKKFSRGQLSSVAIVLGLASRAPVTLLDEPYLGLDVTARSLFYDVLLRDFAEHPRAVVLSTHLIEESEGLFDRILLLEQGRIVVDNESDQTRALAFQFSGVADAVDRVLDGLTPLRMQSIGGLKSATVSGPLSEDTKGTAEQLGVRVTPATLKEVVAAYGANETAPITSKERHS
ncbi:ATP-binding cassette domain-containing protein [Leifsonia poae]|uniref:ATP-binding cassette domain-containing protein n=1 Tax=Leifsonia poae TaxID=110933 RepID=UPI003D66BCCB